MILLLAILTLVTHAFSITLQEALHLARLRATPVNLSELDIRETEYAIKKALAGVLPQVSVSYSFLHQQSTLVFGFTPQNRQSYNLQITQVIFNPVIYESIKLAKEQLDLQKAVRQDVIKSVELQVKQIFYGLIYRKKLVELAGDNLAYWEENFRLAKARYESGIAPKVELMRAESQLLQAQASYNQAKADYQKGLEELKRLLREDNIRDVEGDLTLRDYPSQKDQLIKEVMEGNSTLLVARKKLQVARRQIDLQKAQYYPTVTASVGYQGFTGRRSLTGSTQWIQGYTAGISLQYQIFDGFSREAGVAQAEVEFLKQKEQLVDLEYQLKAQLNQILLDLDSLKEQIKAVESSIKAAKESLRLSTERYRYGVGTQLELLDARNNYNNLLANYYLLLMQYNNSVAQLERLLP
ncbi:outer membrane efflux protein [Thermocrinis albus DSM 14484]|uniref:Outer membrane efflux protein n=1 Tax=Thermocrinis albus (strain DSM 14484 / JCM 11386 / HI 11/12) TaxID=638303 RepID=D3SNK4_THEAH|nr:TolC family protein [Thermocrinis albus]ADC88741.1 outer membrane efflux protein [Thermocrinis albus DSM 14484]